MELYWHVTGHCLAADIFVPVVETATGDRNPASPVRMDWCSDRQSLSSESELQRAAELQTGRDGSHVRRENGPAKRGIPTSKWNAYDGIFC